MSRLTPRFRGRVPQENAALSAALGQHPHLASPAEHPSMHRPHAEHGIPLHAGLVLTREHHPVGEGPRGRWQARGIKQSRTH